MTELDEALIRRLQADGRASYSALSQDLGVSRTVVAARVQGLIASGAVRVVAAVHPRILGLAVLAHLSIRVAGPTTAVLDLLEARDAVVFLSETTGPYHVAAEVRVATQAELQEIVAEVRSLAGVLDIGVLLYEHVIRSLFLGEEPPVPGLSLDDTDIAVMTELQRDGRMGFADLGRAVGLSTSACRIRVMRLIDAHVMQIGAIRRRDAGPGEIVFGVGLTLRDGGACAIDRIRGLAGLEFIARTFGRYDLVATLAVDSLAAFAQATRLLRALPSVVTADTWIHTVVQERYEWTLDRLVR